ncbi:MAG: deoxyribodipyrimidine photo-lyase, partial [Microcoleaceae cyanobacterium]
MTDLILMWHRRDIRITDHLGLADAQNITPKVVGVFCLDSKILERDDIAPARLHYLIGCLEDLQTSYQQAGSQL